MSKIAAAVMVAGLAMASGAASAQSAVVGGGATLPEELYKDPVDGILPSNFEYTGVGSGAGLRAFLNNDATEFGGIAGDPIHYAGSDARLSSSQISTYNAEYNDGEDSTEEDFGPLIQIPTVVTPVTLPYRHGTISDLDLTTEQVCGIYAGEITTWNQIRPGAAGNINVVYRTDSSGTTELLARFLASECSQPFAVSTTFTNVVAPVGGVRAGWVGASGSGGVATATYAAANRIGYVSPDYVQVSNNAQVAKVDGALPEQLPLELALTVVPEAPAVANYANPEAWSPNFNYSEVPAGGYPIFGFTSLIIGQCYQDAGVTAAIRGFLTEHYTTNNNDAAIVAHDFVALDPSWKNAVRDAFITTSSNLAVGNATACADKGRG
ncbi:substrate-binding domain-containing protein [Bordetella ansorpii]|uniref:substrate-binding domain-containing protein n=1 Tax=Bordetella ansorpii TaxID=288768 RepID=UPI001C48D331|nr:substrate-binding domain-containing protein [Bordetella ansorpii]